MVPDWLWIVLFVVALCIAISALAVAIYSATKTTIIEETIIAGSGIGEALYNKVHDAGLSVFAQRSNNQVAAGSGFILRVNSDQKLVIVTAAHVVLDANEIDIAVEINVVISGVEGNQNLQLKCDVVGLDKAADIAVLTTQTGTSFSAATQSTLSWQEVSSIGQTVYAMGNPLGTDFASFAVGTLRDNKYVPTFKCGSIESIYISAPTVSGNSGGPVVDYNGQVVGLSNWVSVNDNVPLSNFSGGVNSYMASRIVDRLISSSNQKGYLGIKNLDVVAGVVMLELRAAYPAFVSSGFDIVQGVLITELDNSPVDIPNSRCVNAGIVAGDILVSLNNTSLGVFEDQFSPTRVSWFAEPGSSVNAVVVRPSTGSLFNANIIIDTFPAIHDTILTTYC